MKYSNEKNQYIHSRKRKKSTGLIVIIVILVFIIVALAFVIINSIPVIEKTTNDNIAITVSDNNIKDSTSNVGISKNINSVKLISDYSENTLVDEMETVTFGSYPQNDASGANKDEIEWIVLERQGNSALLLSKYILDCKCYNNENKEVTWETCDLRKWLNDDFYNKAFTDEEKNIIQTTTVINNDNTEYKTSGGNDTNDKLFCLSIDEVRKYFGNGEKVDQGYYLGKNVTTKGTEYAKYVNNNGSKLFVISEDNWYKGNSIYWLRSSGYFQNCSSCVNENGFLDISNIFQGVGYCDYGVRPACWITW